MIIASGDWYTCNLAQLSKAKISEPSNEAFRIIIKLYEDDGLIDLSSIKNYFDLDDVLWNHIIEQLKRLGLFDLSDRESFWTDKNYFPLPETDVAAYLCGKSILFHADYSDPDIYNQDRHQMEEFLNISPPPSIYSDNSFIKVGRLPHPAFYPSDYQPKTQFEKLGFLLFWTVGKLRLANFLDILDVILKAVPSKGSRHPFTIFVTINNSNYEYNMRYHSLNLVSSVKKNTKKFFAFIRVKWNFEQFQWRYRHSWAWKDLFFDLGHLNEQARFVAERLGLNLSIDNMMDVQDPNVLVDETATVWHLSLETKGEKFN
ncbi:hypothetical protein FE394_13440 [Xenorhabdus sp. Reich]|uniref:Uncharacterized protein n=1 Tax=Xenorhabdus littoralis TaxID=2582835 RepID=A0ABU4SNG3_9GAMM|nr:hypothetical protein [Xenorhabdus sp. Reich]MDX8000177.1 hypothetical protein [Xenorhabdus sp. Reich]